MIRLLHERLVSNHDATIGLLHLDKQNDKHGYDRLLSVFTLEDEHRTKKVYGETRIPCGVYWLGLRKEGGFHQRYSDRFDFHKGMLHIQNVPHFEHILIHIGNTEKDTAGCLLVADGARLDSMTVQSSTAAYKRLYPPVAAALDRGEDIPINIIDRDI